MWCILTSPNHPKKKKKWTFSERLHHLVNIYIQHRWYRCFHLEHSISFLHFIHSKKYLKHNPGGKKRQYWCTHACIVLHSHHSKTKHNPDFLKLGTIPKVLHSSEWVNHYWLRIYHKPPLTSSTPYHVEEDEWISGPVRFWWGIG